jgi:hypothetical protein
MHAHNVIVFDVYVVREMELGWLCEIAGRPTFLGRLQMPPDTRMPAERTRGKVGFPFAIVTELGLMPRQSA